MTQLSFSEFDEVYRSSVDDIWPHWNEQMQTEIARHNHAWSPGKTDFLGYLRASSVRFFKAYKVLAGSGGNSLCDVGGFWGVWPVTAKKLGFEVSMTEQLRFYGHSFDGLFDQITKSGVTIIDYDPFSPDAAVPSQFDVVTVMAVFEHYPHSLKTVMGNLKQMMRPNGRLYIEVPNIAYWPKRLGLLLGRTPLAQLTDIYLSAEPFIGHHHEFTIAEINDLARLTGLEVVSKDLYNYTLADVRKIKLWVRHPLMSLAFLISPECRECIGAVLKSTES